MNKLLEMPLNFAYYATKLFLKKNNILLTMIKRGEVFLKKLLPWPISKYLKKLRFVCPFSMISYEMLLKIVKNTHEAELLLTKWQSYF